MFPLRPAPLAAAAALLLSAPCTLAAQAAQPAWVGRFLDAEARQPFAGAWLSRARAARPAAVASGAPAPPPGQHALSGTFGLVVVAATFADVPPPFPTASYQQAWFGATGLGGGYSLAQYYREVSRGRFTFAGTVTPWLTLARTAASYQAHSAYPGRGLFTEYMRDALAAADPLVDWAQYDNDGLDGVANSGDDDGVVDMVALMHPLRDGVCGTADAGFTSTGFRLTSLGGGEFVTHSVGRSGSPIRVNDFVLAAGVDCNGSRASTMNIPIHEMGHALGLPDLNDLDRSSWGVGLWDVMGYGLYMADGRPSHLGAWSLRQLGWANVTRVAASGPFRLGAVEEAGEVLELPVPGSSEHFLLENRQRQGADGSLPGTGMLVWRVRPEVLDTSVLRYRGTENDADPGLAVLQADGRNDLARRANQGDAADPFPGSGGVVLVNDGTLVTLRDHGGSPTGLALSEIAEAGGVVTLRITADAGGLAPSLQALQPVVGDTAFRAQLQASAGAGPLVWGTRRALPAGMAVSASGVVSGSPRTLAADSLLLTVSDASQHVQWVTVTINPRLPDVSPAQAAGALVAGTPLTPAQQATLDLLGNRNGRFDLGDTLILWLLSGSPALPGGLP
jgi:M6 family metalloprotease-like protein